MERVHFSNLNLQSKYFLSVIEGKIFYGFVQDTLEEVEHRFIFRYGSAKISQKTY